MQTYLDTHLPSINKTNLGDKNCSVLVIKGWFVGHSVNCRDICYSSFLLLQPIFRKLWKYVSSPYRYIEHIPTYFVILILNNVFTYDTWQKVFSDSHQDVVCEEISHFEESEACDNWCTRNTNLDFRDLDFYLNGLVPLFGISLLSWIFNCLC